jgi:hypothetical protein
LQNLCPNRHVPVSNRGKDFPEKRITVVEELEKEFMESYPLSYTTLPLWTYWTSILLDE